MPGQSGDPLRPVQCPQGASGVGGPYPAGGLPGGLPPLRRLKIGQVQGHRPGALGK